MKKIAVSHQHHKAQRQTRPVHHESIWWLDGEIAASMRYLSQRFAMPNRMATAVLNDIGTEELATWK